MRICVVELLSLRVGFSRWPADLDAFCYIVAIVGIVHIHSFSESVSQSLPS